MDELRLELQRLCNTYKLAKRHNDCKSARHFINYAVFAKKLLDTMCADMNNVIASSYYAELDNAVNIDCSAHFVFERGLSQRDNDDEEVTN